MNGYVMLETRHKYSLLEVCAGTWLHV